MSQYVKSWKQGESVFWRGPFGGFPYRPNQVRIVIGLLFGFQSEGKIIIEIQVSGSYALENSYYSPQHMG